MKKIVPIVLALVLACCSGCGKSNQANSSNNSSNVYTPFYEGINTNNIMDYLVKDGKTDYKIVIPDVPSAVELQASSELQIYVQQVSGVFVPTISESEKVAGEDRYFSIGNTDLFKNSKIDYDRYGIKADGFLLKNNGKTVFVMSRDDRGILYGVYEFLEKIMNIRFFAPDETYIPTMESIPVYEMDIAASPYFAERTYMNGLEFGTIADNQYVAHSRGISYWLSLDNKFGGSSSIYSRPVKSGAKKGKLDHNIGAYVDPDIYWKDHPDFFWDASNVYESFKAVDIVNGITEDGELDRNMEISVLKILIEELKKDIIANPKAKFFLVEQADGADAVNKDKYASLIEKYGASGVWVRSMNVVCREIREWAEQNLNGREINIVTFAYQQTQEPPVKMNDKGEYEALDPSVIPDKNLVIRMALYGNSYYSYFDAERQNSDAFKNFIGWSAICNNFMFWGYDIDFHDYLNYFPSWQSMSDNVKGWYDAGVQCLLVQAPFNTTTNWQTNIRHYVYSKLFWDYNLDVSLLIKEYITGYYGAIGGEYVQKFMALMDSHYAVVMANVTDKNLKLSSRSPFSKTPYVNSGVLTSAIDILNEGIDKINASSLTQEVKNKYLVRMYGVLATPMWMILNNYDEFYPGDREGRRAYATEFFDVCEKGLVNSYNEATSIFELRKQFLGA